VEPCHIKLDIEVSEARSGKAFAKTVKLFNQKVKVSGFRPGKVPRKLLLKRFSAEIADATKRELMEVASREALEQEEITPGTNPFVENEEAVSFVKDQPFVFAITFDVAPEFELPEYKGLQVTRDTSAIGDDLVQGVIDGWLQQRASYEKVDRAAAAGDLLKATYKGVLPDGIPPPPQTSNFFLDAQETWLALREPELIPGTIQALMGVEAGDEKDVEITFPDDFGVESFAGQVVEYHFKIHEVHAAQVPEFDDDIAKELGGEDAASVRESVRGHLKNQQVSEQQEAVQGQILQALTTGLEFSLPPRLLQRETSQILRRMFEQAVRGGASPEDTQSRRPEFLERADQIARQNLKAQYLLNKIADAENIQVDQNEIARTLEGMAKAGEMSLKTVARRLRDSGRFADVVMDIRRSKALSHIISLADITEIEGKQEQD